MLLEQVVLHVEQFGAQLRHLFLEGLAIDLMPEFRRFKHCRLLEIAPKYRMAASAARPAVSVRSTRGPSRTATKPAAAAAVILRVEAAFGTDQQYHMRRRRQCSQRCPRRRRHHQPQFARRRPQAPANAPAAGCRRRPARGCATLLAGRDGDAAPVLDAVRHVRRRDAPRCAGWPAAARSPPQLDGLLHRQVHLVGSLQRCASVTQRRFGITQVSGQQLGLNRFCARRQSARHTRRRCHRKA